MIDSSPDVIPDESGRTVWMWRDDEAGESSARSRNKKSFVVRLRQPPEYPLCFEKLSFEGSPKNTPDICAVRYAVSITFGVSKWRRDSSRWRSQYPHLSSVL